MSLDYANINDNVFVIAGEADKGKSASLEYLTEVEGIECLNAEPKKLTFAAEFGVTRITDPEQIFPELVRIQSDPKIHTVIIESISYLMDMYETIYVIDSEDTRAAWGQYQHFWKKLMFQYIANMTKNVIFTSHVKEEIERINEATVKVVTKMPVKGALKNTGLESAFTTIVAAKCLPVHELQGYENDLLDITEDDIQLGYKYVFQTRKTKDTFHEPIRSPRKRGSNMWSVKETYIDNNAQHVLNRLRQFYSK